MKKFVLFLIILISSAEPLSANLAEFHFRPIRRRIIFVEDYYKLYRRNLYGSTAAHIANIYYLKKALKAAETNRWWAHPVKSFAYVGGDWANPPRNKKGSAPYTEMHHAKYKELMKMRISLLLTKSFLKLGSRYDRENIYWFNSKDYEDLPYAKRKKKEHYLKRSFRIARAHYIIALFYWYRTKHYVLKCWEGYYIPAHIEIKSFKNDILNKISKKDKVDILTYYKKNNNAKAYMLKKILKKEDRKKIIKILKSAGYNSALFRRLDLKGVEMDKMEDEVYKIYHGGNLDSDKEKGLIKQFKKLKVDISKFKNVTIKLPRKKKHTIELSTTAENRKKYRKLVKRYKEEEKRYFHKENHPEFNYDKVIKDKLKSLVYKNKKLDEYITRTKRK